jgi:hypothetical protein
MDSTFALVAVIVIIALTFDYANGFHDAANRSRHREWINISANVLKEKARPKHGVKRVDSTIGRIIPGTESAYSFSRR